MTYGVNEHYYQKQTIVYIHNDLIRIVMHCVSLKKVWLRIFVVVQTARLRMRYLVKKRLLPYILFI